MNAKGNTMKKTPEYFRHDYNARHDEKIIRLIFNMGWEGYGLYWAIVELLYIGKGKIRNDYTLISYELRTKPEMVERIVTDYELFYVKDGNIRSRAINERLEERAGVGEKRSASASKRWDKERENTSKARVIDHENTSKALDICGENIEKNIENTPIPPIESVDANAMQMQSNCIHRIEQNRIVENRIEQMDTHTACPHQEIIKAYHSILPELPRVKEWTEPRQKLLRGRWDENSDRQNIDWWKGFFSQVKASDFLCGRIGNFRASLEWLIRSSNFVKVTEGNYSNREGNKNGSAPIAGKYDNIGEKV